MKERNNRFLAGTLAGLMMLTMLPVTALARRRKVRTAMLHPTPRIIILKRGKRR